MKLSKILLVSILLSVSCVDPLKIKVFDDADRLVVDGEITDAPGPYKVRLFHSSRVDESTLHPIFEKGASIWIIDDTGQEEKLIETDDGIYETQTLQGVAGKSYHLKIITTDGREYASTVQQLYSAGNITAINFEYVPDGLPGRNPGELIDALNVSINAQGVSGQPNLLRWRYTCIYLAKAFPELRTYNTPGGPMPDPVECSGYIYDPRGYRGIRKVGPCTCCDCWSYNYNSQSLISDNQTVKDIEFQNVSLGKIQATQMQFYDKYYIDIDQLTLSPELYDFWNLVRTEQQGTTSIFQPNAVKIRGNMHCVTDPSEVILGVFAVSGITSKSTFIDKSVILKPLLPIDTLPDDCRQVFINATTERPPFW